MAGLQFNWAFYKILRMGSICPTLHMGVPQKKKTKTSSINENRKDKINKSIAPTE